MSNEDISQNPEKLRALVLERGARIERLEVALSHARHALILWTDDPHGDLRDSAIEFADKALDDDDVGSVTTTDAPHSIGYVGNDISPQHRDALEACPFCGGNASIEGPLPDDGLGNEGGYVVCCEQCGASSPVTWPDKIPLQEAVAKVWNRRHLTAPPTVLEAPYEVVGYVNQPAYEPGGKMAQGERIIGVRIKMPEWNPGEMPTPAPVSWLKGLVEGRHVLTAPPTVPDEVLEDLRFNGRLCRERGFHAQANTWFAAADVVDLATAQHSEPGRIPDGWVHIDDRMPPAFTHVALCAEDRYENAPGVEENRVKAVGYLNDSMAGGYWSIKGERATDLRSFPWWSPLAPALDADEGEE